VPRWADDLVLDDPAALETADPGGMLRATADAGAQVRRALSATDPAAGTSLIAHEAVILVIKCSKLCLPERQAAC
jgi:hypothetical protein